ncbi:MAG: hypothetical protein QW128_00370 [Thermoprotei archaeon]
MSLEEELRISFKNPLSLILTVIAALVYILLLAIYQFNKPDPIAFGMSAPLVYALTLWIILVIIVIVSAIKVWG